MSTVNLTGLLGEDRWLRELLRGLLSEQDAADAAQDTWLAALRRPPQAPTPGRGWLAVVARNLAARAHRQRVRVARREAAAARPEAVAPAADSVARLELQQRVARAVLGLDEPFRTAVLLRYYEGLTPAAIAARLGVPAATVRTRVLRGLERLRHSLDADTEQDWRGLALVFLAPRPALLPGVLLATGKSAAGLAVAALGLVLLLCGWWWFGASAAGPEPGPALASAPAATAERRTDATGPAAATRRQPVPTPAPPAPLAAPQQLLRGRVCDTTGRALAGVLIGIEVQSGPCPGGPDPGPAPERFTVLRDVGRVDLLGRCAADGSFAFTLAPVTGRLWALGDHATVRGCSVAVEQLVADDLLLLAAPAVTVAGLVVDEQDRPVPGAEVVLVEQPLARCPLSLERTFAPERRPELSDVHGGFALGTVPAAPELRLRARALGHAEASVAVPGAATRDLHLVLPTRRDVVTVRGVVHTAAGQPAPGATVACAGQVAHADAQGQFTLQLADFVATDMLCAVQPGLQPALVPDFGAGLAAWRGKVRDVVLTLGGPALAIAGQVFAPDGQPFAGVSLVLLDPTCIGGDLSLENIAGGRHAPVLEETFVARTDAEGRFRVTGLAARSYRLRVVHVRRVLALVSAPIAAGREDVVLRFAADAVRERLSGRVLRRDGTPVAGATVVPTLTVLACDAGSVAIAGEGEQCGQTDAEGRFLLRGVPRREVLLTARGEGIAAGALRLAPEHPDEGVALRVQMRCAFRIEPGPAAVGADHFAFLDEAGAELLVERLQEGLNWAGARAPLTEGHSPVLSVSDAATTLVWLRQGRELLRRPVVLRPGPVQVLRP